ncbi:MAG: hypothetical protein ACJ79S_11255 [Gemmatimonadaceae bacterium]
MPSRRSRRRLAAVPLALLALLAATGCDDSSTTGPDTSASGAPDAPADLSYQLIPSGDPDVPDGILLRWTEPNDDRVADYVIYSRASTSAQWSRRAATTSSSFHDAGVPHLQYYVASEDAFGNVGRGSSSITVEERNRLPAPSAMTSITLDGAVQLAWPSNGRTAGPTLFDYYRVYSAPYDLDAGRCDDARWVLEGSTVSEDFLVTGLANGSPRCFAASTVSRDGHESAWTTPRHDTPRYDARNVVLDATQAALATSGFRFYEPGTQRFGIVLPGDRTDIDFKVDRRADGSLWLTPVRADVRLALYSTSPVTDLTSIDVAPARSAFAAGAIEAVPGYAYVFELQLADGLHYGAVRVSHVGRDYLIFDWAYQSDRGNPELNRVTSSRPIPH